ncbi:MAG: pilus assembly protein [Trichloromonadaceae bacterium]
MTTLCTTSRWVRLLGKAWGIGLVAAWLGPGVSASTISQVPLPTAANVPPNIMLLLDNSGSMNNVVPDAPYDPATVYLANCPAPNLVSVAEQVELRLSSGEPRVLIVGQTANFVWGAGEGQRCFDSSGRYLAKLAADGGTASSGYLPAEYRGNYLNWYFQANNTSPAWNSGQQKKPGTATRMEITKGAANSLLDTLDGIRVGLSTYNGGNGASILQPMTDIRTGRADLKSKVNALVASGETPLAEALRDLGDYFAQGQDGPLLMYPDNVSSQSVSKSTLFARNYTFTPPGPAPIQYFCQKNFALLMTDGRPTSDNDIASVLRDYDGDCQNASPACLSEDRKPGQSYESSGTDYLDDVAAVLHDIDLRPDLNDQQGAAVKNNLITYTIGFADDQVLNDPLMRDTAANGGGKFFTAANAGELSAAFAAATNFILSTPGSSAAVAVNGPRLSDKSVVFQAVYNSGNWTGDLKAFQLDSTSGEIIGLKWEASRNLPAVENRNLYTWNPAAEPKGVKFDWDLLNDTQKQALSLGPNGVADDLGKDRVAYLRGVASLEKSGENSSGVFRGRISLLGDIVNSNPVSVSNQNFGYDRLPGSEGSTYPGYRSGKAKERSAMVYAGANDGFLHGFKAETGEELFGYMPAAVLPQANQLTFPGYTHRYFVDGPPRAGDAFLSGGWRTILLGTPGAGGRGLFALDVTDPKSFSEKQILWEISSPELGFVLGTPTMARLQWGWVAITGNGYASDGNRAMLLVYDLLTGKLLQTLDTGTGSAVAPNGLSAPIPVDFDGDRITDAVYAGDLKGNLWKFDLGSSDPAEWKLALGGNPLFTARDSAGRVQPVTARPEVGRHPQSGVMVYFGTGKYFETGDNDPSQNLAIESFYGIWDQGSSVVRKDLAQQSIIGETILNGRGLRTTTKLGLGGNRGWYIDLAYPSGVKSGERVVSTPLLRHGRVIFPSITPSNAPCSPGGSSWLMELDAVTGGRLEYSAFDIDKNKQFNEDDYVTLIEDGKAIKVPVSGLRQEAIIATPGVVSQGEAGNYDEIKYIAGPEGTLEALDEKGPPTLKPGRRSWRQLQ